MSEELKPCPFCGGEAQRYTVMRGFENRQVCCKSCGASAFDLKWDRATTPSQGLDAATVEPQWCGGCKDTRTVDCYRPKCPMAKMDAATVERCAQACDAIAETARANGAAFVAAGAEHAGHAVRVLATDPHQHGGRGA